MAVRVGVYPPLEPPPGLSSQTAFVCPPGTECTCTGASHPPFPWLLNGLVSLSRFRSRKLATQYHEMVALFSLVNSLPNTTKWLPFSAIAEGKREDSERKRAPANRDKETTQKRTLKERRRQDGYSDIAKPRAGRVSPRCPPVALLDLGKQACCTTSRRPLDSIVPSAGLTGIQTQIN
ncbi:uncharacterized protein LY79DRAFT_228016 [Colletotrichum navitas]|uniref:Uncharacterized protein n=1 Tax=Colletotrichum navitas TaxID=681940 RepID=A0AAD8V486_9PEZI|nr:uncharacterized protein LY79DRAFT_228016 [Colletotrichum navitas]KAK1590041.1 hypothetical protein LY79DRAFT_228016 [Colletotrichum navitas]